MTNNAINSNIPIEITKGGTQNTSFSVGAVLVGNGASPIVGVGPGDTYEVLNGITGSTPTWGKAPVEVLQNGSNGQIIIGGGSSAAWNTITPGTTDITITNAANSITIASTGGPKTLTCAFCVYASPQTTTDYDYEVKFTNTIFDIGGDFSSPVFTAPSTGYYQFSYSLLWYTTSSLVSDFAIISSHLYVNGGSIIYGGLMGNTSEVPDNAGTNNNWVISTTDRYITDGGAQTYIIALTAGDTVSVYSSGQRDPSVSSSSDLQIADGSPFSAYGSVFCGVKLL